MAQIIRYVDPDAAGAGNGTSWTNAYTSLSACEAAEQQNLTDGGGDYMTIYCRSSGGTNDTTNVTFDAASWTTSATCYIEIIGSDFPTNGILDTSKYVLHITTASTATCLTIAESFIRVQNLQIQISKSGASGSGLGISITAGNTRIDSCIVHGVVTGSNPAHGISMDVGFATTNIFNTLIYDFNVGTGRGIASTTGTILVRNSTVYNCVTGMLKGASGFAAVTPTNCAVGNNTDDFSGTMTIDYCCSDDGDGTNAQGPSGADWANEFTNIAGGDFSLKSGGNCVGNGTDDPGSGLYSDDIIGAARSSVWDIGAFEYVAPPAAVFPMIYQFNF